MAEAIRFKNVSKKFILHHDKARSFQEMVVNLFHHDGSTEEFWALKNVSVSVPAGESLGLIGQNGSGKSTVLKLVSGILRPTSGRVRVNGRVSALLELGAGFHPDLTGKENVYLNGSILGLRRKEIDARFDEIVDFSELERFIDIPIKHYSSGMYMRLGFAVAVMTTPDILVIDEVLAVGDDAFRQKCLDKISQMRESGVTILFVSHAAPVVKQICDRAILLHDGELAAEGDPGEVLRFYDQLISSQHGRRLRQSGSILKVQEVPAAPPLEPDTNSGSEPEAEPPAATPPEHDIPIPDAGVEPPQQTTSGEVSITSATTLDGNGAPRTVFRSGESMAIEITFEARAPEETPNFILSLLNDAGIQCHFSAARWQGLDLGRLPGHGRLRIYYPSLPLGPGEYSISVLVTRGSPDLPLYDRQDAVASFEVEGDKRRGGGLICVPQEWSLDEIPDAGQDHTKGARRQSTTGTPHRAVV